MTTDYKNLIAEFTGTFILVLLGTGSIVIAEEFHTIGTFGIGVVFGMTVWLLVQFLGRISDCHINPAVTLTLFFEKQLSLKKAIQYIALQLLGALTASTVVHLLFPLNQKLGNTLPRNHWQEAFIFEFFLSFVLMMVILVSSNQKKLIRFAPFLIGFTVFMEAWLAGPVCGASMNPARSFGPAMISGNQSVLWIYFAAPSIGMLLSLYTYKIVSNRFHKTVKNATL